MSLLSIQNLGKAFRTYRSEWHRFARWFGISAKPSEEHWALRHINFDIQSGEAIGIIGQNGAGKSTLLKLITGTLRQTEGTIHVNGRISAILELGMGFNPELTGRQNVAHAAGLMGFSAEKIQAAMPDIESFAEIGHYFDEPVRTYSSGMQMRVAFAVATAYRPEILIIDEALSVGDAYFQHKSFGRIREFKEHGVSIMFVSHSMADVRALCDYVILLDKGSMVKEGLPDEVVDYYNAMIADKENAKLTVDQRRKKDGWLVTEYGNGFVRMEEMELFDAKTGEVIKMARVGQQLIVKSRVRIMQDIDELVLGHRITDRTGHIIWGSNTWHQRKILTNPVAGQVFNYELRFECMLGPGSYSISFGLHSDHTHIENCYHKVDNRIVFDVMNADREFFIGTNYLNAHFKVESVS